MSNRQLTRGRSAPLHAFSVRAQDNGGRDKESTLLPQHRRPGEVGLRKLLPFLPALWRSPVPPPARPVTLSPTRHPPWPQVHPVAFTRPHSPSAPRTSFSNCKPAPSAASIGTGGRPTSLLLNQTTPFHEQLPRHRAAAATVHCPTCSCPPPRPERPPHALARLCRCPGCARRARGSDCCLNTDGS